MCYFSGVYVNHVISNINHKAIFTPSLLLQLSMNIIFTVQNEQTHLNYPLISKTSVRDLLLLHISKWYQPNAYLNENMFTSKVSIQ